MRGGAEEKEGFDGLSPNGACGERDGSSMQRHHLSPFALSLSKGLIPSSPPRPPRLRVGGSELKEREGFTRRRGGAEKKRASTGSARTERVGDATDHDAAHPFPFALSLSKGLPASSSLRDFRASA